MTKSIFEKPQTNAEQDWENLKLKMFKNGNCPQSLDSFMKDELKNCETEELKYLKLLAFTKELARLYPK
jgi:hypothetical protein